MLQKTNKHPLTLVLGTLLFFALVTATPPPTEPTVEASPTAIPDVNNYNCPEDCHCAVPHHTHTTFLHAKCSSIAGLKSEAPLLATLPIHSIDLSYLNLSRLSHSLEKLRDVTSIDLSHNQLHEIGHLGRRIKKLNLKHNHITSGKLGKLPLHVQVLNLRNNDITYLPLEFMKLAHLQTLDLSHNQINCSCETLEVRNWLQDHHVFMENPVKCAYPPEVKGMSWLQVKQSDICEKEKLGWFADEEDNELMMGDQPFEGSAEADDDEELGKAFMPIDHRSPTTKSAELDDVEGSGDLSNMNMPLTLRLSTAPASHEAGTTDAPDGDEEDDGSGSGGGMLIIPSLGRGHDAGDEIDSDEANDHGANYDNRPVEEPSQSADIFGTGMGIFDDPSKRPDQPATEEAIVPVVYHPEGSESGAVEITGEGRDGDQSADILAANVSDQDDSNATYFLMAVLGLIVVGLILYVGIRRCKQSRHGGSDAENPRQTMLLDMDKNNLGKPVQRNGHENAPLIGEKTKADLAKPINGAGKKPYGSDDAKDGPGQQQPLINGSKNGTAPSDVPQINAPAEPAAHEYYPITPRYPTPKSPRASKYAQYPQGTEPNNNDVDDPYNTTSSPKSGRYSPVYSPETGRVKIKLTETPKPKTPMLVTRSKSNAGDIVTTPVRGGGLEVPVAPIHVGGVSNGHVDH